MAQLSQFFGGLVRGHWPHPCIIRETTIQSIPFVMTIEVSAEFVCFFTVSYQAIKSVTLLRVWGLHRITSPKQAVFPYGGPWIPLQSREIMTLPELDLALLPVWARIFDETDPWQVDLRWHEIKLSLHDPDHIVWSAQRTRLRPLPPIRQFLRLQEDQSEKGVGLRDKNRPAIRGLMPLLTHIPTRPVLQLLNRCLKAGDAVLCSKWRALDLVGFDDEVRLEVFEDARVFACDTLVLWYPSEIARSERLCDPFQTVLRLASRARCMVAIVENDEHRAYWQERCASTLFYSDDPQLVALTLEGPAKPSEWRQLGRAYQCQGLIDAAKMCLSFAGEAWGKGARSAPWSQILQKLRGEERDREMALAFERVAQWGQALGIWRRLGEEGHVLGCRIEMLWEHGEWRKAARLLMRHGLFARAAEAYERAGKTRKALGVYLEFLGDWQRALAVCERSGELLYGATRFEKFGFHEQALELYQRCEHARGVERLLRKTGRFEELEETLVVRGDRTQLLDFYEHRGDPQKCIELMAQEKISHREAIALFNSQMYFPAYVRLVLVQDWALAGQCALKLSDYRSAAQAFLRADMKYEAGLALAKTRDNKRALALLLATDRDEPKFHKSNRVLMRIKDRKWSLSLADKLKARGALAQAAWLYEKIGHPVAQGEVLLSLGRGDQALAIWERLETPSDVDQACAACLQLNSLAPGIKLLLDCKVCFGSWLNGAFTPDDTPHVFDLAWRYFTEHDDPQRLRAWAVRLSKGNYFAWLHPLLNALELLGDYRALLSLISKWRSQPMEWSRFMDQIIRGKEAPLMATAEGRVLRNFLLDQGERFNQAMAELTLSEENAPLFLLRASFEVATSFLVYERMEECVVGGSHPLCLALGHQAKARGLYRIAAVYFLQYGAATESLLCLEQGREFALMAQLHMLLEQPMQAVEAYQKLAAPPNEKIALAYETAGLWGPAAYHYELAGDGRRRRRCQQRFDREQRPFKKNR